MPDKKAVIWMSHYPHWSWPHSGYGSWMLHGHCHGMEKRLRNSFGLKVLDVGVDCFDYKPVSYNQVKSVLLNIKENI